MPAIRTFARSINDSVTVHIPAEYRSYSLEIIVLPMTDMTPDVLGQMSVRGTDSESADKLSRKESADRAYSYLMAQDDGGIDPGWHFDRGEANSR